MVSLLPQDVWMMALAIVPVRAAVTFSRASKAARDAAQTAGRLDLGLRAAFAGDFPRDDFREDLRAVTVHPRFLTSDGVLPRKMFWECGLCEVVLADGVLAVGDKAFRYCASLRRVDFGASVRRVGRKAFDCCTALAALDLPAALDSIEESAFSNTALVRVAFPAGVTVGKEAFYGCTSLVEVDLGGVREIGDGAFFETALRELAVGPSVEVLGEGAFAVCGLRSVRIRVGPLLTAVPAMCFWGCSALAALRVDGPVAIGDTAFRGCDLTEISLARGSVVDDRAFDGDVRDLVKLLV